jgi:proton-coupled amino acid transporter
MMMMMMIQVLYNERAPVRFFVPTRCYNGIFFEFACPFLARSQMADGRNRGFPKKDKTKKVRFFPCVSSHKGVPPHHYLSGKVSSSSQERHAKVQTNKQTNNFTYFYARIKMIGTLSQRVCISTTPVSRANRRGPCAASRKPHQPNYPKAYAPRSFLSNTNTQRGKTVEMMTAMMNNQTKSAKKRLAVCSATTVKAADAADASGENAAVVNTIKAIFGAGGFALPWAFAQGGTVLVTACLLSSLVLSMETLRMLVAAQDVVVNNNTASESDVSTYAGLTKVALGSFGENLNKTLNVVTCFGITVSYLLFISETAVAMFPAATAATITKVQAVSAITPLVLGLSWIRNMAGVNIISLVGTCSVALGMLVCAVSAVTKISMPASLSAIPVSNVAAFPGFFGTVAFLFFIHFTLFGIQQGMPQKDKFLGAASKAFVLSAIVGGLFGIICAVGFGPNVSSVVITMLEGPIGVFVKALLCVNLLFTFPIMAQSALVVCESVFTNNDPAKELAKLPALVVRSSFVLFAALCATLIPNFGAVLGYVGGVCCCAMTLVLPPVILDKCSKKAGQALSSADKLKIPALTLIGVVCMILSVVL